MILLIRDMELKQVQKQPIQNEKTSYTGWGFYENNSFIPHGCGKKYYSDYHVYGNFERNIISGPAMMSFNYYMKAMQYINDKGNGWGLCINRGTLAEFGYYKNSQLENDLTYIVEWYYRKIEFRIKNENMLHMYTYKESKNVSELLIGFTSATYQGGFELGYMGFRFKNDGSVWVGDTDTRDLTGLLIHFKPDGCIDAGIFHKGKLEKRMNLKDIMENYDCSTDDFKDRNDIIPNHSYFNNSSKESEIDDEDYMMPYRTYEYSLKQNGDFEQIEDNDFLWEFYVELIATPYGPLDIKSVKFIDDESKTGVQFVTEGVIDLEFDNYRSHNIRYLTVLKQPNNVWIWVYLFDENGEPVITFCGRNESDNSFDEYIYRLRKTYIE